MQAQYLVIPVMALALAGCGAATVPLPTPDPIPAATTCDTVSDVLTLLYNADISLEDGRSSQQEHNGAVVLASRVLSRIQVEPGSDLEDPVGRLLDAVPLKQTQATGTFDRDSAGWTNALDDVTESCAAAGSDIGVHLWTGG